MNGMNEKEYDDSLHLPNHRREERIVAFIDILGFKNLVDRMNGDGDGDGDGDGELFEVIRTTLERVAAKQEKQRRNNEFVKERANVELIIPEQAHFSDCIVHSCEVDQERRGDSETAILLFALTTASDLLQKGIFVRGGIASGWAYHKGNVLFGKGVIAAYDLERQCACVPRIIVADDVVQKIKNVIPNILEINVLRKDSDSFFFINIFKGLLSDPLFTRPNPKEEKIQKVREYIDFALTQARDSSPDLLCKYSWLANQFNIEVDELKKNPGYEDLMKIEIW